MDEGRRLEGLVRPLPPQARFGEPAELLVDQREQLGRGGRVTGARGVQHARDRAGAVRTECVVSQGHGTPLKPNQPARQERSGVSVGAALGKER